MACTVKKYDVQLSEAGFHTKVLEVVKVAKTKDKRE